MARPRRKGRSRTEQTLSTDVRRFRQRINADEVFGTHKFSEPTTSRFGTYSALRCLKPLHGYDRGGERQVALIQVNNVGCRILLLFTPVREGSGETPA